MTTVDKDDPYRGPTTDIDTVHPAETRAARTPGFLEMLLILLGSAFVGGITFFATCIGTILPLGFLQPAIPAPLKRHQIMMLWPLAVFLISTAVSGYVAFRTGQAIFRWFNKSHARSD